MRPNGKGVVDTVSYFVQVEALTDALLELPVVRKLDLRGNEAITAQVRSLFPQRSLCASIVSPTRDDPQRHFSIEWSYVTTRNAQ